ncbi:hypothetical protein [Rhizobium laguerreae]|uniref:hypothetical protein n=1 Tax=Rhizobium laguerreae TaxID=1076926 RepID=UPI001C926B3D|nr:hypothetical protein [Rhizobium laguerreae]MBY3447187.1 hypothetical protein [Rhizobium laguerreae]
MSKAEPKRFVGDLGKDVTQQSYIINGTKEFHPAVDQDEHQQRNRGKNYPEQWAAE